MCGRFAFFSPKEAVIAAFGVNFDLEVRPRYNIAPSQDVIILLSGPSGQTVAGECRWGLVPFWAKDPAIGNRMINARAETIGEKPAYRQSFSRRRCLVLASGFYEWRKEAHGKTPYFISRADGQPFGMAAIWDEWSRDGNESRKAVLRSCAIITAPANEFMQKLHDRMPVMMDGSRLEKWLSPDSQPADLHHELLQAQTTGLDAWAVSRTVNNPINEGPELIAKVSA